jgi:transcriptional regulator with XRE-family HTH domain
MDYAACVSSQPNPLAKLIGANCKQLRTSIGVTQDVLAVYACNYGLRWDAAKVGRFESGSVAPTFATVLAVTLALQAALDEERAIRRGAPYATPEGDEEHRDPSGGKSVADLPKRITLGDLVGRDGTAALNENYAIAAELLNDLCNGRSLEFAPGEPNGFRRPQLDPGALGRGLAQLIPTGDPIRLGLAENRRRLGLAESRMAKRLGITPDQFRELSLWVWGVPFTTERDLIAGEDGDRGHFLPSTQYLGAITRRLEAELRRALAGEDMGERPWREGRRRWHGNDK